METRTRGRARNNPVPEILESPEQQTTLRTTRRTASAAKATIPVAGYGSLTRDPIPRRGAQQRNDAKSIASLESRNKSQSEIAEDEDEDDEDGDDDNDGNGDVGDDSADGEDENEPGRSPTQYEEGSLQDDSLGPDDEQRYQIMAGLLPDFIRAADELRHRLVNGDYENKVFAAFLKSKRIIFYSLLETYLESGNDSSFIDIAWAQKLCERTGSSTRILDALLRANIVNALDGIQKIRNGTIKDPLPTLKGLDSAFMHLFTAEDSTEDHWKLALDLRTCYLIAALESQGAQSDVKRTLAFLFCKETNSKDYAHLIARGPFKSLTRKHETETSDDEDDLISKRTTQLHGFALQNKKDNGLARMRAACSLDRTLEQLSQCLNEWYINSKDAERSERAGQNGQNGQTDTGRDSWHDAEETIPDSGTESQPIVRPTAEEQRRASLFQGTRSLRDLRSGPHRNPLVPPSNQQQHHNASSFVPDDYSQHETRDLLRNDVIRGAAQAQKRNWDSRNDDDHDDEDGDDDDEFENDTRKVPESRISHIKALSADQAAKRQRLPANPPSRSMPPPPPRSTSSLPPSTEEANYENINRLKSEAVAQARARALDSSQHLSLAPSSSSPTTITHAIVSPPKQRYVWSIADCNLLIRLIKERHAAWAAIEREHNHQFEHPRNQQAYRDKARNMKVDFLITDTVLPPGFDLVTLSKKEITRLLSLGKNPYRRESDRADNTTIGH